MHRFGTTSRTSPSYKTPGRIASELFEEHKTDSLIQDRNIILQHTFEYRMPSALSKVVEGTAEKVVKNMTSRYLGLVVVPGEYITKIELEQFASQFKEKNQMSDPSSRIVV